MACESVEVLHRISSPSLWRSCCRWWCSFSSSLFGICLACLNLGSENHHGGDPKGEHHVKFLRLPEVKIIISSQFQEIRYTRNGHNQSNKQWNGLSVHPHFLDFLGLSGVTSEMHPCSCQWTRSPILPFSDVDDDDDDDDDDGDGGPRHAQNSMMLLVSQWPFCWSTGYLQDPSGSKLHTSAAATFSANVRALCESSKATWLRPWRVSNQTWLGNPL